MISMNNELPDEYAHDVESRVRETLSWLTQRAGWASDWHVRLAPLDGSEFLVTIATDGQPIVSCAFHAPGDRVEETLRTELEGGSAY
jgi:hypothetical protein